jgi:hypothetical protein
VADNARPPVAVRIVRPYQSEEAFLESELETVGKTSVILIGAHSRPTGVILRFEVTLTSGVTILRGEGRVLAHKENAFRGQPGLALRFTRLDPKSKALVDRAAAIREARLSSGDSRPPSNPPPSRISAPPPPITISHGPGVAPRPTASALTAPPNAATVTSLPPDPVLAEILTTSPTPPPPATASSPPANQGARGKKSRRPAMMPTGPAPADFDPRASGRPTGTPGRGLQALQDEVPVSPPPHAPETSEDVNLASHQPSRPPVSTIVDDEEVVAKHESVAPPPVAPSAPPPPVAITPPTIVEPPPAAIVASAAPEAPSSSPDIPLPSPSAPISTPTNRDDLLSRLRARAAGLSEEQRAAILRR